MQMRCCQQQREADAATIGRLQATLEALQDNGESQASQMEAELLERSRECSALRREAEQHRRRAEELARWQQETAEAAKLNSSMREENATLRQQLEASQQEQHSLNAVVERCLTKMEQDSRERPHLVDKRMVTQMVAAYLEQRDHPRQQQEILTKMADLLGFSTSEREQVGLLRKRKALLDQEESGGFADLSDRFVDFLLEESET